jgi:tetratricopeptide (TPR) repeat protein
VIGRAAVAAVTAVALAACSAPPVPADLARAYERERAGDVDGALAAYDAAAARCDRALSRHRADADCGRALLGKAALLADRGRTDEAIAAYVAIAARTHDDPPPSAEGLFRAGRLAYDADRAAEAAGYLWAVVEQYPDEAFAADALAYVVRRARGDAPRPLWDRLVAAYATLRDTDVADNLLWALAELAEHELADPAAAVELYDRIPRDHPTSGLRDDSRWRAAALLTAGGDYPAAADRLRALVATREVALGAARTRCGSTTRSSLARLLTCASAGAAAAVASATTRGRSVDDARRAGRARGTPAAACAAAARLLAKDAASRFADDARARQARLGCPEAGR